jgi:tetratricopeptide (TPR) repeat protein
MSLLNFFMQQSKALLSLGGLCFLLISCHFFSSSFTSEEDPQKEESGTSGEPLLESYDLKTKADQLLFQKHTLETCQEALALYQRAQELNPTFKGISWRKARAFAFWYSHLPEDSSERKKIAQQGLLSAEEALEELKTAEAHYYFALFTGYLAQETFAPDPEVAQTILKHGQEALELDPSFDYGGPHRLVGTLYLMAPPYPSVGDKSKAVSHLKLAVEEFPDSTENQLFLGEALFFRGMELVEEEEILSAQTYLLQAKKTLEQSSLCPVLPSRHHLQKSFQEKALSLLKSIEESEILPKN